MDKLSYRMRLSVEVCRKAEWPAGGGPLGFVLPDAAVSSAWRSAGGEAEWRVVGGCMSGGPGITGGGGTMGSEAAYTMREIDYPSMIIILAARM